MKPPREQGAKERKREGKLPVPQKGGANADGAEAGLSCHRPLIPLVAAFEEPLPEMMKIGEVAERLGISVQAIRLYESEGLLISFKSAKGTRWYGEEDVAWIGKIKDLISEGLNFEGIRRLLAQVPCWALRPCRAEDHARCSMRFESRFPCWIAPEKLCTEKLKECYHCNTYRSAPRYINLKSQTEIVPLEVGEE